MTLKLKLKSKGAIIVAVLLLTGAVTWLLIVKLLTPSPEQAMHNFYTYGDAPGEAVAEDMLMDPLILAGEKVVLLVIEAVKNKEMERRRYAIAFLGNGSYRQAIPVLEQILVDASEKDYFRGDALLSIYLIDEPLGLRYALEYKDSLDALGEYAKDILRGRDYTKERRSYSDAILGKHD